ncbi:MAG: PQQ-binding-like beta-propeller repeat protein [Thermodesulfobacteriota bacterium]
MRWLGMIVTGLVLGLVGWTQDGRAATEVSGVIDQETTWREADTPHRVTGGVSVAPEATLIIEPGVEVLFDGPFAIQVEGTLQARGTAEAPIRFRATAPWQPWGYILFRPGSTAAELDAQGGYLAGSVLEHCLVTGAGGLAVEDNGAIIIDSASPLISHCQIIRNRSRGIEIHHGGAAIIRNSTIAWNTCSGTEAGGGGIRVQSSEPVIIDGNRITNNSFTHDGWGGYYQRGGGILASGSSETPILVTNNLVAENAANGGGGIYATGAVIQGNLVRGNISRGSDGGGIAGRSCVITGNVVVGNSSDGDGGGISQSGGADSDPEIAHNVVAENLSSAASANGAGLQVTASHSLVTGNAVVNNIASAGQVGSTGQPRVTGLHLNAPNSGGTIALNTICGNQAANTVDPVAGFMVAYSGWTYTGPLVIRDNNLFNNMGFELYVFTGMNSPPLAAEDNFWGTSNQTAIAAEIHDWQDDATLGVADFLPFAGVPETEAPVSPPRGLTARKEAVDGQVTFTWQPNPEPDVAGYRLYWAQGPGTGYDHVLDVGNRTSAELTGLSGSYRVAVSAYDHQYLGEDDDPLTIVNEAQTSGHESWYSTATALHVGPALALAQWTLDFGNIAMGTCAAAQELTITNTGDELLTIDGVTVAGPQAEAFLPPDDLSACRTLAPGGQCTLAIGFCPAGPGLKDATIALRTNDTEAAGRELRLVGVGDPPGRPAEIIWEHPSSGGGTPAMGANGDLYAGSNERPPGTNLWQLYAFRSDGTVKWQHDIEGDAANAAPAVALDGTIYVTPVYGQKFYALTPDGEEKWVFQEPAWAAGEGWTWSSPAIGPDGTIYFGSREPGEGNDFAGGKLYALSPDGTRKWATVVGTPSTTPAIAADGTIHVGTGTGLLYALDPQGGIKWIFTPELPYWVESTPAIGPDGVVYVGSMGYGGKRLYAIGPDGAERWFFEAGARLNRGPVLSEDGTILIGAEDGELRALSPEGVQLWSFRAGGGLLAAPAIGAYGTVFFGAADGKLYAVNPHGTLSWTFDAGSPVASSPLIGPDGSLYFGTSFGSFFALSGLSPGPAASAWPMPGHDYRRSGVAATPVAPCYPGAKAGDDILAAEGEPVALSGEGSASASGGPLLFRWQQLSGPPVALSDPTDPRPAFRAPTVGAAGATLLFRLTVTDENGLEASDLTEVQVTDTLVSPAAVSFGSVETGQAGAPLTMAIHNTHSTAMVVSGIGLSDPLDFNLDLDAPTVSPVADLPRIIPAGDTAFFVLFFSPTTAGHFQERLVVETSDPDSPRVEIPLSGWGQGPLPEGQEFVVRLGEDTVWTAGNIREVAGGGWSDGQNATASVDVGPYESGQAQAWAGVRFRVEEGPYGATVADATIAITLRYQLAVDFDALTPQAMGGGSADSRLYGWILVYKQELDSIDFVHQPGQDSRSATVTMTHRLAGAPTWTHLYAGQTYEVKGELAVHAEIFKGNQALASGEVTVERVAILFDDTVRAPRPDIRGNNQDGPLALTTDQPVALSIALDAGSRAGERNDWFLLVERDGHLASLVTRPLRVIPGVRRLLRGPLVDVDPITVLDSRLPAGSYTFHFAVSGARTWVDSLRLQVREGQAPAP